MLWYKFQRCQRSSDQLQQRRQTQTNKPTQRLVDKSKKKIRLLGIDHESEAEQYRDKWKEFVLQQ